jgi:hypothetical protein
MTLRQKQSLFAQLVGLLIAEAYRQGYELTLGEAYRPPETAALMAKQGKGITNSNHVLKLAIDVNLFKDGVYLSSSASHKPLGDYWKKLNPLCRWGGDFNDGNHYSLEHNGVK